VGLMTPQWRLDGSMPGLSNGDVEASRRRGIEASRRRGVEAVLDATSGVVSLQSVEALSLCVETSSLASSSCVEASRPGL
jgi:hypothetical protein